jgi:hypothetical protein
MKIKSITKEHYNGVVHNIGVKDTNNYFIKDVLVHNCYLNGNNDGKCVEDAAEKIKNYFGQMTPKQRPFQVAIPGSGELFEHPDWENILRAFKELDIEPNYTTNGMWVDLEEDGETEKERHILNVTKELCGGVAVSCHPHIKEYWEVAANYYADKNIKLNFHIIISDRKSIDEFIKIYLQWKEKVDYFVLLPYGNQGRAPKKEIEWEYLVENMPEDHSQIAFGANFYPYLKEGGHNIKVSLYEPEIMSSFISLYGKGTLYSSSFNTDKPIKTDLFS